MLHSRGGTAAARFCRQKPLFISLIGGRANTQNAPFADHGKQSLQRLQRRTAHRTLRRSVINVNALSVCALQICYNDRVENKRVFYLNYQEDQQQTLVFDTHCKRKKNK